MITPELFRRYPTPSRIASAAPAELEELIRPTGFFRRKVSSIMACSRRLVDMHGGEVPADLEALVCMPGVGRKTANVVLAGAFGQPAVAVDTHVGRVAVRLGLAKGKDPDKIEKQLCALMDRPRWSRATLLLGTHGRRTCSARKPDCPGCAVARLCDYNTLAR
jgi:endonuclease-3